MQTKVSAFCERAIEAGYLLALVIAPLFFNVFSNRVFEPDKLGLLRSIAVVMLVAWIVQRVEEAVGRASRPGNGPESGALRTFLRMPLVIPTLLLAAVYLFATLVSVTPRTSFWGSYQRLQGTYSTLSYLVIFLLMLQTLRRQEQLRRLWTTIILTSAPIALYGLMQHYRLDPLPWGGDVTDRVTSNMGNAIFVAAYLIMVIPLTLARVVHSQTSAMQGVGPRLKIGFVLSFWVLLLVEIWACLALGFGRALAAGLLILIELVLVAAYLRRPIAPFILMGTYGLLLSIQLATTFFTQSRGPWLGLLAGLFFLALLFIYFQRWRIWWGVLVSAAVGGIIFLAVINVPRSPLSWVRDVHILGRLARLTEIEGTNRVRALIWQGNLEMLRSNPLRALIGYGPESMYVAYNPFYPPDLAHVEARNASPDRSHNETFDSLIITGVMGFALYLTIFGSAFYYGFRWLGLIRDELERRFFFACCAVGGVGAVILLRITDGSLRLAGIGLPLGLVAALVFYALVATARRLFGVASTEDTAFEEGQPRLDPWGQLLLAAVFAGIVGHFLEINLGIAIASTRTYFWAYAALLVALGKGLVSTAPELAPERLPLRQAQPTAGRGSTPARSSAERRKGGKRRSPVVSQGKPATPLQFPAAQPSLAVEPLVSQILALAAVAALIFATMNWDYVINPLGESDPLRIIIVALTTMAGKNRPEVSSLGMLWLSLASLVMVTLAVLAEVAEQAGEGCGSGWWLRALGWFALVAWGIGGLYGLVHAGRLGPGSEVSLMLYEYYLVVVAVWGLLATALYRSLPRPWVAARSVAAPAYAVLLILSLLFVAYGNIRIIRADAVYKQGYKFDGEGKWDYAITYYQKALDLVPEEDFYHLFLGRALMERAKQEKDPGLRDTIFREALTAIQQARKLNPLNTDHTANLARLYRTWAEMDADAGGRAEKLKLSLAYYEEALKLSPHSAQLYNEWGLVYYVTGDVDRALATYQQSLTMDPQYVQTYLLIGDVYIGRKDWPSVLDTFRRAVTMDPGFVQGWSALGYAYSQMGQMDKAIAANKTVQGIAPDDYNTLKNLSILYSQMQSPTEALSYAEQALVVVPGNDKATLEDYIRQLREQMGKGKP